MSDYKGKMDFEKHLIVEDSVIQRCDFDDKSFSQYLFDRIDAIKKDSISQVDGVTGKCLTFQDLNQSSKQLAASLKDLGVLPGETISVSSENRLEFSSVLLASIFSGLVFAPINPAYYPGEILHALKLVKPRVVFCSALTLKNIGEVLPSLEGVNHVITFDEVCTHFPKPLLQFQSLIRGSIIKRAHFTLDTDIALILNSSGTTGLPKGVMLSYKNLKFFFRFAFNKMFLNPKTESNVILGLLPLFHGYGYSMMLASIIMASKYVLLPKFVDKLFLSTIQTYKITHLYLVPPLVLFLATHPMVLEFDLSSVREVVCGAAPLSEGLTTRVLSRFPAAILRQGYGLTESTVVVTVAPFHNTVLQSVGRLAPGIQAVIVDIESGKPLGRNQQGEIWLRGDCVMAGYCDNPLATRDTIDPHGWLHTGDIGYVDLDGNFFIVDRIKELIKYKGFQVAPAELESILMKHRDVADAAIVGVPDVVAGELPVAYVVLQPHATVTKEGIISFVNGKVSPQKHLRDVRFINKIPRNLSGKILRRELKALSSKL